MHDIKWIRDNAQQFDQALAKRGLPPVSNDILEHDEQKRKLTTEIQSVQQERNEAARAIGQIKDKKSAEFEAAKERANALKQQLASLEQQLDQTDALTSLLASLPNVPANDVPEGPDESANEEVRTWGAPREFSFTPKEHVDLGESLGYMDFARTAEISGSRFVTLSGPLARLERALAAFMLDVHTEEFGYTEVCPPLLVWDKAMYGVGQLPKFAEDSFQTTEGYRLIPTAEVPLTNMVQDSIVDTETLPLRYAAYTPCFRSEAGSAGKDTRGMIRQHQFTKVELVSITTAEQSNAEHERLVGAVETILQRLDLPYRLMILSSGDMGFSAQKTYDFEVWMPGQDCYREISSCSNCGDFQARRMKARHRPKNEKQTQFVHTLNGSGLAIGRTMIAILENYQQEDGTIALPEVLQPYMGGITHIK